ncbi:YjaG family protein [Idiomarina seosinensis]|uniref:YjaG family protein n=1 Tax=Idiomarina seosinensis TaxID=281739 RepID=UPI00384F83FE
MDTFQRIRQLDWPQQALLALYLCERMLPNYQFFHQITAFGDSKPLRGALNACWDQWLSPTPGKVNYARWQDKVDEVTPSEYGHDLLGVYPAMDACTAISSLLQGMMDKESQHLVDVAKVSQASVFKFIELNDAEQVAPEQLQQHVQEHELYQYELAMQQAMIDFLASQAQVSPALVKQVRQMVKDEGISNLGLELEDLT